MTLLLRSLFSISIRIWISYTVFITIPLDVFGVPLTLVIVSGNYMIYRQFTGDPQSTTISLIPMLIFVQYERRSIQKDLPTWVFMSR